MKSGRGGGGGGKGGGGRRERDRDREREMIEEVGMEWQNGNDEGKRKKKGGAHVRVGVFLGKGGGGRRGATLHSNIYNVLFFSDISLLRNN